MSCWRTSAILSRRSHQRYDDNLHCAAVTDHQVQLALLTATVKLFIRRPTAASSLLPKVLKMATEEADNPDLRDRASHPFSNLGIADVIGIHVLAFADFESYGCQGYRAFGQACNFD